MKILFFANLREYTKCKEINIDNCSNVEELLQILCIRFGKDLEKKIKKNHGFSDEIIILVNGRNILNIDGIKTSLDKDDVISIFPVVAGG